MAQAANAQPGNDEVGQETLRHLLERLRHLRQAAGLTQEQFSESAGISYKYYQAVEAGRKRELRLSTLERLAQAHGLEVWELLAPTDSESAKGKRRKRVADRSRKSQSLPTGESPSSGHSPADNKS